MLLVVFAVFIAVFGLAYALQDKLFFYNIRDQQSREFLQGRPGYSEVTVSGENNITYHGAMYQATNEKAPLIIYFGGNGEVSYRSLRNLEENGRWEYFTGYHFLFMDYEGYGINEGQTNQQSMYQEALAVYDYVLTLPEVDADRIISMGYSLGTASAVYLAANRQVAGLILVAPYANGTDLYNNILPIFHGPLLRLVRHKLPSDSYAPYITCPALVIASRTDGIVPFSSSQRLSEQLAGPVDFMKIDKAAHSAIFRAPGVYNRIALFLSY